MPELPEVERARRLVERVAMGRTIARVWVDDDDIVFSGVKPRAVARALKGRRVVAVRRRGKQLWWELDRRPWPVFHFGMTGQFLTPRHEGIELAASPRHRRDEWPPRFAKIRVWLDDGGELAMTNARRLGRIRLLQDPMREPPISRLGFDPLTDMPSRRWFLAALERRKAPIKAVLLDQQFAAGVGNWLADEVLYQARIDPRRRACDLEPGEAARVHTKLRAIVRRACDVEADKGRFPRTWLFHHRWGRGRGKRQEARTARGERILHTEVAGRTTAWVPAVQK